MSKTLYDSDWHLAKAEDLLEQADSSGPIPNGTLDYRNLYVASAAQHIELAKVLSWNET